MKVAAAVPRVRVADCDFNASEIIRCVNEAVSMEVQVIVFPELCITGYSCGDLFFQETLLHGAVQSLRQIADATLQQDIIVIVGMPLAVESLLLNTAVVLQGGRMLGVVSKSYLPNYREFQEKRWFVSACCCDVKETILHQQLVPLGNDLVFCTPAGNFGIELCEDLWAPIPPSSCLAMNGADVIFNLSASDECSGKHDYLCSLLTDHHMDRNTVPTGSSPFHLSDGCCWNSSSHPYYSQDTHPRPSVQHLQMNRIQILYGLLLCRAECIHHQYTPSGDFGFL